MSGFADLVRNVVATANTLTSSLQVVVSHYAWINDDENTEPEYDTPVSRNALVTYKTEAKKDSLGSENLQSAIIEFFEVVTENGADERSEPIDPRDKLVLPDGSWGPITGIDGIVDPSTGKPYLYRVTCGDVRSR